MPKSTRLSTIAADINIGKESIVDFLNSNGFPIENKATANLTEEMVEQVYKNFNKEKLNVDKQRKRFQEIKQQQPSTSSSSSPAEDEQTPIEPTPPVKAPTIRTTKPEPRSEQPIERPVEQPIERPVEKPAEPSTESKKQIKTPEVLINPTEPINPIHITTAEEISQSNIITTPTQSSQPTNTTDKEKDDSTLPKV